MKQRGQVFILDKVCVTGDAVLILGPVVYEFTIQYRYAAFLVWLLSLFLCFLKSLVKLGYIS